MSKRDIKAKRWGRKQRQFERRFRAISSEVLMDSVRQRFIGGASAKTESPFGEKPLRFIEQVRRFGDGRWQYRDAALVRRFSLRRRGVCLAQAEWRDC